MRKIAITFAAIASLATMTPSASANDLIKMLAAFQGNSYGSRYDFGSRQDFGARGDLGYRHSSYRFGPGDSWRGGSCDIHQSRGLYRSGELARLRALERAEEAARLRRLAEIERLERLELERLRRSRARTHVGFRVQSGAPALPAPPIVRHRQRPLPPVMRHAPPAFGEIVTCDVPLYTRLRIRDRHNIAPGARKMIVAVRAPGACDHACSCCADRVVYVCVWAPPCEPRRVDVSPCGGKIRMDFGRYEIDIVTYPTFVKVDYDN